MSWSRNVDDEVAFKNDVRMDFEIFYEKPLIWSVMFKNVNSFFFMNEIRQNKCFSAYG